METETKKHQRITKRRERAQQIYQEKRNEQDGSADEMDDSPPRSSKDKGRLKPRRRRNSSNSFEEDIIDGFSILSFKSFEDLENVVKNCMNPKQLGDDKERKNCLSPKDKNKSPTKRKYKKKLQHCHKNLSICQSKCQKTKYRS